MKLEIRYSKSLNEIVALVDNNVQSLKTLQIIDHPHDLIAVLPFMKHVCVSDWVEEPYGDECEYEEMYLSSNGQLRPHHLLDIEPNIGIEYTRNEVGEHFYRLYANLPKYVLNGLAHTVEEYADKTELLYKFNDFLSIKERSYIQYKDQVFDSIGALCASVPKEELKYAKDTLCPESIPHVRVIYNNHTCCIPLTNDKERYHIIENLLDYRRTLKGIKLQFFNIWKCSEVEDGYYHLNNTYHTSEDDAKKQASEIWHMYISRAVSGVVTKL